jgi:hypothetical protein
MVHMTKLNQAAEIVSVFAIATKATSCENNNFVAIGKTINEQPLVGDYGSTS